MRTKGSKNKKQIKGALVMFHKTFRTKGATTAEAISNLKPDTWKGISVLTLQRGNVKIEKILGRSLTFRLFGPGTKLMREIALKQVSLIFDSIEHGVPN